MRVRQQRRPDEPGRRRAAVALGESGAARTVVGEVELGGDDARLAGALHVGLEVHRLVRLDPEHLAYTTRIFRVRSC